MKTVFQRAAVRMASAAPLLLLSPRSAAAHLVTTGLFLINGFMVGLFAIGLFQCMTSVMESLLW